MQNELITCLHELKTALKEMTTYLISAKKCCTTPAPQHPDKSILEDIEQPPPSDLDTSYASVESLMDDEVIYNLNE